MVSNLAPICTIDKCSLVPSKVKNTTLTPIPCNLIKPVFTKPDNVSESIQSIKK